MALWGNKDLVASTGTVTINLSTKVVTGSATTFSTANVSVGDVITVGTGATYGQAIVKSVTSNTSLSIGSTQFLIPHPTLNTIAAASYVVTQKPKYTLEDHQYNAPDAKSNKFSAVFGVDTVETGVARTTTVGGKAGAYGVSHSGWVGVTTYKDTHGNLRVKSETLVAGSHIVRDANDDARFPDS